MHSRPILTFKKRWEIYLPGNKVELVRVLNNGNYLVADGRQIFQIPKEHFEELTTTDK